jgi:hypothetical protein
MIGPELECMMEGMRDVDQEDALEYEERYNRLFQAKKCPKVFCEEKDLKKRRKPPRTGSREHKFFDYWQCPTCKTNYAYLKKRTE